MLCIGYGSAMLSEFFHYFIVEGNLGIFLN